jgi:hypothetical protein
VGLSSTRHTTDLIANCDVPVLFSAQLGKAPSNCSCAPADTRTLLLPFGLDHTAVHFMFQSLMARVFDSGRIGVMLEIQELISRSPSTWAGQFVFADLIQG